MKIFLIRHGVAAKRNSEKFPDDDARPLTRLGEKQFLEAVEGYSRLNFLPEIVISSPVLRAAATAGHLITGLKLQKRALILDSAFDYNASHSHALRRLSEISAGKTEVAIVGHEPWLGEFVSLLLTGTVGKNFPLDKGGGCLISWKGAGTGKVKWFLTQKQAMMLSEKK